MTGPPSDPAGPGAAAPGGAASAGPPAAARSPGAFTAPFRGGSLLGFLVLAGLAWASARAEGGVEDDPSRLLAQPLLFLAIGGVLAFYAHRVVLCALENDRPVPWLRDPLDGTSAMQDLGTFAAAMLVALAPAMLLSTVVRAAGAPSWAGWVVAACGLVVATLHLPFALASSVLRQGVLGAGYGGPRRAWRANCAAAWTAARPAALFLGLFALSFMAAGWFVRPLREAKPGADVTTAREAGRYLVLALRVAGAWAAFSTFRQVGAVARDVPEIREALS